MKKIISIMLTILVFFTFIPFYSAAAKDAPPSVSADSVVVMDAATSTILYSKNMDTAYPPASTTKIMTALLTLEKCKLDDVVKVGKNPPFADGSKIYIFEDEEIKVNDLLHGLLLSSANDCAEALAEHIGGSIEGFAKLMNKEAKRLGCKNTNFVNPSGLFNENHKTSANDLALIMRELSKYSDYTKIATTLSYNIQPTNKSSSVRPLWNENRFIQKNSKYYYDGCIGGKTGYTTQSQHSYVCAVTRNNQKLVVALVHDGNKTFWEDTTNLLNYCFKNYELVTLYSRGQEVTNYTSKDLTLPLLSTEDFYYVKEKGTNPTTKYTIKDKDISKLSFKRGDKLLEADVTLDGKSIGTLKLSGGMDHETKIASIASKATKGSIGKAVSIICGTFAGLVLLLLIRKRLIKIKRIKKKYKV